MIKKLLSALILLFVVQLGVFSQNRQEISIPDIPGFFTMKCDFHMHTVFSDGNVWPTFRVQEAWQHGLDAISITDHIEYLPHSQDIDADHNRSFEIAKPLADQLGIILIQGSEITRKMPPGHLNALFIKNANLLEREDWWEACLEAKEQGAFVFWNHPGWKAQQPDTTLWWKEHTRLLEAGIMNGIEVFNHHDFYPEALTWAKERNLTVMANSDVHGTIDMNFESFRPVTLVFTNERSAKGIRQALEERRTVAYFDGQLAGDRKFLSPIFFNSIKIANKAIGLKNHEVKRIWVHNNSDISYKLKQRQPSIGFSCPSDITLGAHQTVLLELTGTSDQVINMGVLKMYYEVENLQLLSGENLPIVLEVANK
ncbi:Sb-PDE family phosphodiesterase [Sunxiuqinia sp. A32]|uniref:Sb-PDE family phosphodiesterase n=1 Tax=Sunxiuqinia sp. A32 TaxID=3461496 RepID=UPI0040466139